MGPRPMWYEKAVSRTEASGRAPRRPSFTLPSPSSSARALKKAEVPRRDMPWTW